MWPAAGPGLERDGADATDPVAPAQLGPARRGLPRPPQPHTHPLAASSRVLQCQQ